jgi:hypothetical protein
MKKVLPMIAVLLYALEAIERTINPVTATEAGARMENNPTACSTKKCPN